MSRIIERSVGNYFPSIYEGVVETNQIVSTEDSLFSDTVISLDKANNNQYILTADSDGLTVFERILSVTASPSTETVEFRRQRLISRFSSLPPFTYFFLVQHLNNIIGEGNFSVAINVETFTLTVRIRIPAKEFYPESEKFLKTVCPANIVIDLSLLYNTYEDLSHYTYEQLAALTYYQMREEVLP